jgi:hypothetical protein
MKAGGQLTSSDLDRKLLCLLSSVSCTRSKFKSVQCRRTDVEIDRLQMRVKVLTS